MHIYKIKNTQKTKKIKNNSKPISTTTKKPILKIIT